MRSRLAVNRRANLNSPSDRSTYSSILICEGSWRAVSSFDDCAIIVPTIAQPVGELRIPDYATISARADSIARQLAAQNHDVASDCDFDKFIAAASEPGPEGTYRSHSPVLTAEWDRLRDRHGDSGVDQFNAILMCRAIVHSVHRMESHDLPEPVRAEYAGHYVRILDRTESAMGSDLNLSADLVAKDLGLCTQRLFAAGYAVVETAWSMPRRHILLGGARQFVDFGSLFFLRFRGKGPFLNGHFHPECTSLFTPEGRIHMLKVIAMISEWRPVYKALIGDAWYYDPVVAEISPHLAFVRNYLEENGALFFRGPPDPSENAFMSSKRRRMWERGEYQPRRYMMVWPRDSLVAWYHRDDPPRA